MKLAVDTSGAEALTKTVLDQIPYATALALTRTAQQAQRDIVQTMAQVFDRPTPFTLNSIYIKPATKANLVAEVFIKTDASKGTPAVKYLAPEVTGGLRNQKRGEKALIRMGYLKAGSYFVPGSGLSLNQYGNITAGNMTKILSSLGANPDQYSNITQKSRLRAIAAGKNVNLFVGRPGGGRLPLGVWQRLTTKIKPLLIFIDRPPFYRERLHFLAIAQATYARVFKTEFDSALKTALLTARVKSSQAVEWPGTR